MIGATESFGNGLTDLYVIKTDENGVVEWHSTFGGPNIDYGKSIVETNDSSFIACGYSNSLNLDYDIFVVKMDKVSPFVGLFWFGTLSCPGVMFQETKEVSPAFSKIIIRSEYEKCPVFASSSFNA